MRDPSLMIETWLPVVGYEGLYDVSDRGRVLGLKRGKLLNPLRMGGRSGRKYRAVHLCRDGVRRDHLIHRLVLEAFVGPCPSGLEGCHEDDDKTNNRLSNLRWDSHSENMYDCVRNGNHPMQRR